MFEIMKKITEQMVNERQFKHFREYRMLCDSLRSYIENDLIYPPNSIAMQSISHEEVMFLFKIISDEKELFYIITQKTLKNQVYDQYKYAYQIHLKLDKLYALLNNVIKYYKNPPRYSGLIQKTVSEHHNS